MGREILEREFPELLFLLLLLLLLLRSILRSLWRPKVIVKLILIVILFGCTRGQRKIYILIRSQANEPRERDEKRGNRNLYFSGVEQARQDNKNLMHNNTGEQMTISKYKYIAVLYCHICNHSAGSAVVGIVENLCLMFLEGTTQLPRAIPCQKL